MGLRELPSATVTKRLCGKRDVRLENSTCTVINALMSVLAT